MATVVDALRSTLGGYVSMPGDDEYRRATSPLNSSFPQRPCAVVRAANADQIAQTVRVAKQFDKRIVVQGTGHGAAQPTEDDHILVDTSSLSMVTVDAAARTATVEAGARWPDVQQAAYPHGLLGLSGTSPTVGVAGYTFSGGVGWLVRKYGLGSAALRAVEYVDGAGRLRRAADDASDHVDREALWAFRGGGPVGLATALEIDLHPVAELWTGYLLWRPNDLGAVVSAWAAATSTASHSVTSTLSVLKLPPHGPFPDDLLDSAVVHLSYASPDGRRALDAMAEPMRAVATPVIDTTGPGDVRMLSQIHLDPPAAVPARGTGRWLGAVTPDALLATLHSARVGQRGGLNMVEVRHTDAAASTVDGAMTDVPGPFLLHAVGAAPDEETRARVDDVLHQVETASTPMVTGRPAPAFRDGQFNATGAMPVSDQRRLGLIRHELDPDGTFTFHRHPAGART